MIPTPDLSHLTKEDFEYVYEPAEDTFLLLDALEVDAQDLKKIAPTTCLEIGSGSGCVLSFIGGILGPSALYLSTDINSHACRCTRSTGAQNKVSIDPINVGFASPLYNRLKHGIDLIVFNPPYVPTFEDEVRRAQDTRDIQGSWAGGLEGMGVTGVFLEHELLSGHGRFYLVAVKDNNLPKIQQNMLEKHGLQSEVVLQRRAGPCWYSQRPKRGNKAVCLFDIGPGYHKELHISHKAHLSPTAKDNNPNAKEAVIEQTRALVMSALCE